MTQDKQIALDSKRALVATDGFMDGGPSTRVNIMSNTPVPTLELDKRRLVVYAVIGAAVVVGTGYVLRGNGITLVRGIEDPIGSSEKADALVEHFQTANGYLLSFIEEASNTFFEVLVAAYVTYFVNRRWSKKDTLKNESPSMRYKELFITWFPPILMYAINVSFTSLFVDSSIQSVKRALVSADLYSSTTGVVNSSMVGIDDTILHGVISKRVEPFQTPLHPKCSAVMAEEAAKASVKTSEIPSLLEISSTSVVYGFQSRDWNYEAIPKAADAKVSSKVLFSDLTKDDKTLDAFMTKSAFSFNQAYELVYQGTLMYERSFADSTADSDLCGTYYGVEGDDTAGADSTAGSGQAGTPRPSSAQPAASAQPATTQPGTTARPATAQPGSTPPATARPGTPPPTTAPTTARPGTAAPAATPAATPRPAARRLANDSSAAGNGSFQPNQVPVYFDSAGKLFYLKDGRIKNALGTEDLGPLTDALDLVEIKDFGLKVSSMNTLVDMEDNVVTEVDSLPIEDDESSTQDWANKLCRGGQSQIQNLKDFELPENQTAQQLLRTTFDIINDKTGNLSLPEMSVKFDHFELGRFVNVTAMTIDIPMLSNVTYHNVTTDCITPEQKKVCAMKNVYPVAFPSTMCSADSCVFIDRSSYRPLRKELSIMPYLKSFGSELEYDDNLFMMLPKNGSTIDNAAFLYGMGSYISGDEFVRGANQTIPYIKNPRRHLVFTFAKLQWQYQNLAKIFNARCKDRFGCEGVPFQLQTFRENNESNSAFKSFKDHDKGKLFNFLLISKQRVQEDMRHANLHNPTTLAAIMSKRVLLPQAGETYEWEYINPARFATKKQSFTPLASKNCSMEVEAYLQQLQANRYMLEEPLYPLYTSSVYFLFQHAARKQGQQIKAKTITSSDKVVGYGGGFYNVQLELENNKERKVIRFKVSGISAVTTLIGVAVLWIATLFVMLKPTYRHKYEPHHYLAERFIEVYDEETYPPFVHQRKLILPTKEEIALDDFEVERIRLQERGNPTHEFELFDETEAEQYSYMVTSAMSIR